MKRLLLLITLTLSLTLTAKDITNFYEKSEVFKLIPYDKFEVAAKRYYNTKERKREILTFIDYTKPSTEKRLYVIDMIEGKLLHHTYVSHGKASGGNYATEFSNEINSNKSSLGLYITTDTYYGANGYSLRLTGLDKGVNDNAAKRAIVIHGAPYANPSVIEKNGRLGRSLGCPALPEAESKDIIETIKKGTLLYIHG